MMFVVSFEIQVRSLSCAWQYNGIMCLGCSCGITRGTFIVRVPIIFSLSKLIPLQQDRDCTALFEAPA
jgi:hypothetical protein